MKLTAAFALTLLTAFMLALLLACEDHMSHSYVCPDCPPPIYQVNLSIVRTDWHLSARPAQVNGSMPRARLLWHNPFGGILYKSVYGDNPPGPTKTVTYMRLIVRPNDSVAYSHPTSAPSYWSGITTFLDSLYADTVLRYLEIRVRGSHGVLHLDFGRINEDVFGDGYNHNEDGSVNGIANGILEEEEDMGLDTIPDYREPSYDLATNPDPNHDNWYIEGNGKPPVPQSVMWTNQFQMGIHDTASPIYYEWINGTEGNIRDASVLGKPDQEKLGYYFNTEDSYLTYRIDLASDSFMAPGSSLNGWRTYRFPINDSAAVESLIGLPDFSSFDWPHIRHSRIWFEKSSTELTDTVEIVAIRFVP